MSITLGELVLALGGQLHGDPSVCIERLAPLDTASPTDLSFLSNPRYQAQLAASKAACVIVASSMEQIAAQRGAYIVADDPYVLFARATQLWKQRRSPGLAGGIHSSAVIHAEAAVHATAVIGPLCVVEAGARVGAGSVLHARVTLGHSCHIGERCILHSGVVIGADGFGFAPHQGAWLKIEQLGAVRIGNDVEIGANSCIDRGALDDTIIADGVKIDNLVQVGHNVHIGAHSALAGCVGVAGSAHIGQRCTFGGGAIVLGHLRVADDVHVSAATVVTHSLTQPGNYTGVFPVDKNARWEKNAATLKQLHRLRDRIKALEQSLHNKT